MNEKTTFLGLLTIVCVILAGSASGQTPFGDTKVGTPPKTIHTKPVSPATPVPSGVSLADLSKFRDLAKTGNEFSGYPYQSFIVGFPIAQATITFTDETENFQRVSWFQQILSEHGCKILKTSKQENKVKAGFFKSKSVMSITVEIKGRAFVLESLTGHYGGTVSPKGAVPSAPADVELKEIVALELKNRDLELEVLRNSYEVDRLIVSRNNVGMLSFSEKKRLDGLLQNQKENLIPSGKSAIERNQGAVRSKFVEMGDKDLAQKQYHRALANFEISGSGSGHVNWQMGNAYMGLKDFEAAITSYKATAQTDFDLGWNGVADASHAKGDDREALNSLYLVLDRFNNTTEELEALRKIDSWGFLKKSSAYPELRGNLSKTYATKGLLNAGANDALAVKDYQRAVEIRADGGNKAAASKAIVTGYGQTVAADREELAADREKAENRFTSEREASRQNLRNAEIEFDRAVASARRDFAYDVDRKGRAMDDAREELESILRRRPVSGGSSGGSTDPYDSRSKSNTDPYSTGPYNSGGGANTDPYLESIAREEYDRRVADAQDRLDRLEREYRWLRANQTTYIDERTSTQADLMGEAKVRFARYDLSHKETYVENDANVRSSSNALARSEANYKTVSRLAQTAGF